MRNMILAIDIGNTNIVVGCIDKEKIYFTERISTIRTRSNYLFCCSADYISSQTGCTENS